MENEQLAKALKQVELIRKYGPRPDVWLHKIDPADPNKKEYFLQEQSDLKLSEQEVKEIHDILDLPILFLFPDNGRD